MSDSEFHILAKCRLSQGQIQVYYRPIDWLSTVKGISSLVELRWKKMIKEARQTGKLLFDSPGYSVDKVGFKKNNHLIIYLTDTTYRDYVTTFRDREILKLIPPEMQPKLLSVFGAIETRDNYLVFGQSDNSTRSSGYITALGGVVKTTLPSTLVSEYLFDEYVRETSEETGIPQKKLEQIMLIGVVSKDNTADTPRFVFSGQTSLTRQEVEKYFSKFGTENQKLIFIKNRPSSLQKISKDENSNWTVRVIINLYQCK